jgi:hypothetical protein
LKSAISRPSRGWLIRFNRASLARHIRVEVIFVRSN